MAKESTFEFDASLRIWHAGSIHGTIARKTGLHPTESHIKGTKRFANAKNDQVWTHDLWQLESPLADSEYWDKHIQWIWDQVRPHKEFFRSVIHGGVVADLCLGCMTDAFAPILPVKAEDLEIMRQLPLGITFNYSPL